jgi:hypothetical protein
MNRTFLKQIIKYKVLIVIIVIGIFFRFYNTNWDAQYFFHPDERNIADAVNKINFQDCIQTLVTYDPINLHCDLNPNFFAYGTLPIYMVKFFDDDNFDKTLVLLRLQSALLSTLSIPLFYYILKKVLEKIDKKKTFIYLGTFLFAINPGMVQFAHFGTFETFLTFEYLAITFISIKFLETRKNKYLILTGILTGMSISTKIISLVLLVAPGICYLISIFDEFTKSLKGFSKDRKIFDRFKQIPKTLNIIFNTDLLFYIFVIFIAFFLSSPYILLDLKEFLGSMNYEGPVANGSLLVFYTQQFIDTTPFVYQFTKIFPYILGVEITILSVLGLAAMFYKIFKSLLTKKFNESNVVLLLIIGISLPYAIFHFSLFVKWTRYMIPLIPFMLIMTMYLLVNINNVIRKKFFRWIFVAFIVFISLTSILNFASFVTRYFTPDPRILASNWVKENISKEAVILTEPYDLGAIPFNDALPGQVHDFDFYSADNNTIKYDSQLQSRINECDYIIILSNRLYNTRFRLPDKFPITYDFYRELNSNESGFRQIVNFSHDNGINYENVDLLNNSLSPSPDETFDVFDNPTIIIYKKHEK